MNKIEKLQEIIDDSDNIVFFGGAGVSTESGIPDFRSESGIFKSLEKYGDTPERLVSHSYYLEHTDKFFSYYKDCLIFPEAEPNPAHYTLARLEKEGKLKAIITQNIDGLHQKAGSKNVLELHGSVYRNYCEICKKEYDNSYKNHIWNEYDLNFILESEGIPHCTCGGIIKPDVILYEEALDMNILNKSAEYIMSADTLIVGGTSLVVYPAAGLINYFKGKNLVLINKSQTDYDNLATLVINEAIGETLAKII